MVNVLKCQGLGERVVQKNWDAVVFDVFHRIGQHNGPTVDHDVKLEPCGVVLFAVQVFEDPEEDSAHEI